MNRRCILYLLLICSSFQLNSIFDSLPELMSYVGHVQEDPEIDNTDWEHPDFSSFYTSQLPTIGSRLKSFLGLKQEIFNVRVFQETLQSVTEQRKKRGFSGSFIQKLDFINHGRLVIFGNLEGAFHSFARSLSFLSTLDILSQTMIFDEASYLVLNGNVINASAYNLETLMLVLRLMQKNPEKVIYIRGKNEQNKDKTESGIYRQLKIIAGKKADMLFNDILNFFDTLPSALYVRRGKPEILKIVSLPSVDFKDDRLGTFLSKDWESPILYADELQKTSGKADIEAIIGGFDYSRTLGLKRYMGPPTTWKVFSSPTGRHKRLFDFYHDAFVIVDSAIHFHDWMISLYLQNHQSGKGFDTVASYNLSTGVFVGGNRIDFFDDLEIQKFDSVIKEKQKVLAELKEICKKEGNAQGAEPGKRSADLETKQLLRVGTSGDISKTAKSLNIAIKDTLSKIFKEKNLAGGIHGVTFQYIFLDDEADTQLARQNYLKFVKDLGVEVLLACVGTASIQQSLDLLKDNKLMLFFPAATESSIFRQQNLKNIVSLSVSYYEQGKALINHIFQKQKPKKIALFYQNDDFGKDGLAGAKAELKKLNFNDFIELSYERNTMDFTKQISAIEEQSPDAIGMFALPLASLEFIKLLGQRLSARKIFFGISDLRDEHLLNYMKERGLPFIFANSLPDWQKSTMEISENYKSFAAANDIKPDPFSFEAYIIAQIFFYLVEQVKGTVTKEKLMMAAEQIKNIDFKGLKLNFNPESRELLDALWIAQNNDEPWIKVTLKEGAQEEEPKSPPSVIVGAQSKKMNKEGVLTFGTSLDLSKTLRKVNESIKNTITKLFDEKNKSGGIHGLFVRDIFLDDAYTPSIARQNYEKLLHDMHVDMIFASRGTPTTKESLDFIKDGRMALFFPVGTDTSIFRSATLKNAISLTASFYEQANALIETLFKSSKPSKIAFFYQNDDFGRDLLDGAKSALKKINFENIIEIPYERAQADFSKEAAILKKENPDAVGLFGIVFPAIELIKATGALALSGKVFFGASTMRELDFSKFMQDKGLQFMYANSLPDWQTQDLLIAQDYRTFASQNGLDLDSFGFEAYVVGELLFYLIAQVEGPITKEKIINAAEKIHDYNFKGLKLNFNPATRTLLNEIWIGKNNNEPWTEVKLTSRQEPEVAKELSEGKIAPAIKKGDEKVAAVTEKDATEKGTKEVAPEKKETKAEVAEVKKEDEKPVMALHGNELLLGNTSDSTKGLKPMTDAIRQGMELAVKEINDEGGINNIRLKINYLSDEYTPDLARKNIETFLRDYKTELSIGSVGTAPLDGYIDLVKNGTIAVFFPFSGSSDFRIAALKNIIHFTPSYTETTGAATTYILDNFSPKKWALLYQNDVFGTVLKAAMRTLLEERSIKDVDILEVPYDRNDVNFTKQVKDIAEFNPDVIGFYGPAVSAQGFIRVADVGQLLNKILYGLSWLAGEKLQAFLKDKGLKMIIPSVLPDPKTSEMPLAQKFRKAALQAGVPLDVNAFEGYLNVVLFAHLLKQLEAPITIEKIMQAGENLKDYDFEGLKLNFNPTTRVLSHETWLDLGDGKEWLYVDLAKNQTKTPEKTVLVTEKDATEKGTKEVAPEKKEAKAEVAEVKKDDEKHLIALRGNILLLGNTSDATKGLQSMTNALRAGMDLGIREINEAGGINNLRLQMSYLDDGYIPQIARKNVETLLKEYNTNLFIGCVGTPTLLSYIDLVKSGQVTIFFPFTGASEFRKAEYKNLIFYSDL